MSAQRVPSFPFGAGSSQRSSFSRMSPPPPEADFSPTEYAKAWTLLTGGAFAPPPAPELPSPSHDAMAAHAVALSALTASFEARTRSMPQITRRLPGGSPGPWSQLEPSEPSEIGPDEAAEVKAIKDTGKVAAIDPKAKRHSMQGEVIDTAEAKVVQWDLEGSQGFVHHPPKKNLIKRATDKLAQAAQFEVERKERTKAASAEVAAAVTVAAAERLANHVESREALKEGEALSSQPSSSYYEEDVCAEVEQALSPAPALRPPTAHRSPPVQFSPTAPLADGSSLADRSTLARTSRKSPTADTRPSGARRPAGVAVDRGGGGDARAYLP